MSDVTSILKDTWNYMELVVINSENS